MAARRGSLFYLNNPEISQPRGTNCAPISAPRYGSLPAEANTCLPLKGDLPQMARRRFQRGSVYARGKRNPVWVARWRESVIGPNGEEIRVQRKEVLGSKKDFPTKRLAERELEARLSPINSLTYRGLRSASFAEFVTVWQNNALTQLKPSTTADPESDHEVAASVPRQMQHERHWWADDPDVRAALESVPEKLPEPDCNVANDVELSYRVGVRDARSICWCRASRSRTSRAATLQR